MADQTSVSRNNGMADQSSPLTIVGNIADFTNDIATLAELQAKLAAMDARESMNRARIPLVVLGAAALLSLGSIPVVLIGLADVIASTWKIQPGTSQLIVGLVALVLAGLGGFFGLKGSIRSLDSFRRSREEMVRNLSWIKTVMVYSGRQAGKRQV